MVNTRAQANGAGRALRVQRRPPNPRSPCSHENETKEFRTASPYPASPRSDERLDGILNDRAQFTLPQNPAVGIPVLCAFKTRHGDRTVFLKALTAVAITEPMRQDIDRRLDGFDVLVSQRGGKCRMQGLRSTIVGEHRKVRGS